ncbi:MAG: tetratricopeptide repeat protein [Phycisphaerales bacterium]|jgi:tetratricopeptide (TPR) repeat protein|nr:tetratricopeptide repeat protein [Phycisphaerales bacterium]
MAGKVNTKFVIILSSVLVLVAGGVGAAVFLVMNQTGHDWEVRGDKEMEAGQFEKAASYYARAAGHDRTNVTYLTKWLDALQHYTPDTQTIYASRYRERLVPVVASLANVQRTNVEAQHRFFELLLREYELSNAREAWENLRKQADDALKFFENSDVPAWKTLKRYRGIPTARLLAAGGDVPQDQIDKAIEDLSDALGADPKDWTSMDALIDLHAELANRAARRNDDVAVAGHVAAARDVVRTASEAAPDSARVLLRQFELDLGERQTKAAQGARDAAEASRRVRAAVADLAPRLDGLFAAFRDAPDEMTFVVLARLRTIEMIVDPEARARRTIALADARLQIPDRDAREDLQHAEILLANDKLTEATHVLQGVVDRPIPPLSLDGLLLYSLKRRASLMQCMAALGEWQNTDDPTAKDAALARARTLREVVRKQSGEGDVDLLLLDARFAAAENNSAEALPLLSRYNTLTGERDPEALWMHAQQAARLNQPGIARAQLEKLVALQPTNVEALLQLAAISTLLRDDEGALRTYDLVLRLDPQNQTAIERAGVLRAARGERDSDDPILNALFLARRMADGRESGIPDPEGAIRVLEQEMARSGHDPRVVVEYANLQIGRDLDRARAAVNAGLAAHPDNQSLKNLASVMKANDVASILIAAVDASTTDEFQRAIGYFNVYSSRGMTPEANEALAKAASLKPDDPGVLELRFATAIDAKRLDEAEEIARRGTTLNADRVGGLSFRGRLEAARGRTDEAVTTLVEASKVEGAGAGIWRMLGRQQLAAGRTTEAVDSFRQALSITPTDVACVTEFIAALVQSGQTERALTVARESERFASTDSTFQEMLLALEAESGDRQRAIDRRMQIAERTPDDVQNRLALAGLLIQASRWDEARPMIDRLRTERPDDLGALGLDAAWHAGRGDMTSARKVYTDFITSRDPRTIGPMPFLAMGRFLLSRGDVETALLAYRQAQERQDPKVREGDKALADALLQIGRSDEAATQYKQIVDGGFDTPDRTYRKRLVESLARAQKYEDALREIDAFGGSLDQDQALLLLKADALRGAGRRADALAAYDTAVARFPRSPMVFFKRAEAKVEDEKLQRDAMADLEQSLRLDPRFWQALRLRARVYLLQDRVDDAITDLRTALRLNPGLDEIRIALMAELIKRGRGGEAASVADEVIKARPGDLDLVVACGDLFASFKDWTRAEPYFAQAVAGNKATVLIRRYVESLLKQARPKTREADAALATVSDRIATDPTLLLLRGWNYVKKNDQARGETDFTAAWDLVENRPVDMLVWNENVKEALDDNAKLAQYLARMSRQRPAGGWTNLLLGQALFASGSESEGASMMRDLAQQTQDDTVRLLAWRSLGSAYYGAERYEEAADAWRSGVAAFPNDWEITNNLAYTLSRHLGKSEDALPLAQKAAELAPRQTDVLDTLGRVYLDLKRPQEARGVLEKALQYSTGIRSRVTSAIHLADACLQLGDVETAKRLIGMAEAMAIDAVDLPDTTREELDRVKERIGSGG